MPLQYTDDGVISNIRFATSLRGSSGLLCDETDCELSHILGRSQHVLYSFSNKKT